MNLRRSVIASLGFSLAVFSATSTIQAQTTPPEQQAAGRGSIVGVVTDAQTGAPLSNTGIQIVGTAFGAKTGADGRFTIANLSPGIVNVIITRIGYSPITMENLRVTAGTPLTISPKMSVQALQLNSVVSTGLADPATGTRAPFSIAQVGADKLDVAPTGSPLEALIGKVAGLQIRGGTMPGADVVIQIRNPLSVTGFTQPLIIVDGVIQMQDDPTIGARNINGDPLDLMSENIESIEVVRGAAAAALYGQRAANGVINIKTKRGAGQELGTTRMTVNSEGGVSIIGRNLPYTRSHQFLMNSDNQFIDGAGNVVTDIKTANLVADPDDMMDKPWPVPIYDNVASLFKPGYTLRNSLALTQNSLATNFSISGGSTSESGIFREGAGNSRENLSLGIDYRGGNKLSTGIGVSYGRNYISNLFVNADGTSENNTTNNANAFLNAQSICKCVNMAAKDPVTGDYLLHPDGLGSRTDLTDAANPLYIESHADKWDRRITVQVDANATYRPISLLSINTQGGYIRQDGEEQLQFEQAGTLDLLQADGRLSQGEWDLAQNMNETYNGTTRLSLLTGMGGWTVRGSLGTGGTFAKRNSITINADTLTNNQQDLNFFRLTSTGSTYRQTTSLDYTANVALDFNQKYILDVVYRSEGNSLLPPDTRWRSNGRASAAWAMSEESWWPFSNFTLFKPRYSIGTAGNNPLFSARYELYSQLTGTGVTRITKANLGNDEIRPEEATEQEFGLDVSFQNRYSLSFNYVRNTVKDQIRADTILAFTGFDTQQTNLGDLQGNTYEATLEAQWISKRDLRWSSTLTLDRSRQKITSYPRNCDTDVGNENDAASTYQRYCTGYVFGQIYGRYYVTDTSELSFRHDAATKASQFQYNDEGYLVWVGEGGDWKDGRWGQTGTVDRIQYGFGLPIFRSIFDNDGFYNGFATKVVGMGIPDFSFGLNNQLTIKRLTVSAQASGQVGGQIYNQAKLRAMNRRDHAVLDQGGKPDYLKKPLTYYTGSIQNATLSNGDHQANYGGLTSALVFVYPYFIEDATFLKLRELRVAYRLDSGLPLLRKIGMTSGSIALIGRDLFTIDSYSGYDPEVAGSTSATTARVDRATAPNYRAFTAQLRLVF